MTWAEPDVHQAAAYLRRLKDDPAYREQIVRAGQQQIRERLNTEQTAEKIRKRLDEIVPGNE